MAESMMIPRPSRSRACVRRASAVLLLLLAATAADASAQVVRGRLLDEATRSPVGGAFVTLRGPDGAAVRSTLAGDDGWFQLAAPAPGEYRVRVERLGYQTYTSELLRVSRDSVLVRDFVLPQQPVVLPAITAGSERQCTGRRDLAEQAAQVWEEARKALEVASFTATASLIGYEVEERRRTLSTQLRELTESVEHRVLVNERSPFHSAPVMELVSAGFVQPAPATPGAYDFHGPDADVLLSDAFGERNCWRAVPHPDRPDLVGLEWQPVRGTRQPWVRGTLWVDRATAELRHVDFRYVYLPENMDAEKADGTVGFLRLRDGRWIVNAWRLRAPRLLRVRGRSPRADAYEELEFRVTGAFDERGWPIPLTADTAAGGGVR